jgi:predicted MFS family arabinose efflux permease
VTVGLLAIVYGLTTAGARGWGDPHTVGALALGVALLVAFWLIERRAVAPLVPVTILSRGTVAWGNTAGLLAFATETSLVFLLTLYLQKVLGYPPLGAGLSLAVLGAGTVLGGLLGPKLIGRLGAKRTLVAGFLVQALATAPLTLLGPGPAWIATLMAATFVGGVANLAVIVGFLVTATSGLPDREQGLATGMATMSQQVGITIGIPIMSAVVAARVRALGGETSHTMLTGITTAVAVNTALCVAAALLIGLFLEPVRRGPRSVVRPGLDQ